MGDGLTAEELDRLLGGGSQDAGVFEDDAGPVAPLSDLADEIRAKRANRQFAEGEEYPTLYTFGEGENQQPDPDGVLRTQGIIRDIYARHGIPLDTPIVSSDPNVMDAVAYINQRAEDAGAGQSMWANPKERADAQYEYAIKGRTPEEVQTRWDESQHLMDPATAEYYRDFVRDQDFLTQLAAPPEASTTTTNIGGSRANPDIGPHKQALQYWDKTRNNSPIWSDYHRNNKDGLWIAHTLADPDSTVGSVLMAMEQVPNAIRMAGSGESEGLSGAWQDQRGLHRANQRYRPLSPAPIGNLPSNASVAERQQAIKDLQAQVATAAIPNAQERWARTTGFVPPGIVQDIGDGLISTLDPTFLIPVGGTALKGASIAAKAARLSGKGWMAPAMKQLGKQTAAGLGWDQLSEQGLNLGIPAAISPEATGARWTSADYWTPRMAKPGDVKDADALAAAKETRRQFYESADPESVSAARNAREDDLRRLKLLPFDWKKDPAVRAGY